MLVVSRDSSRMRRGHDNQRTSYKLKAKFTTAQLCAGLVSLCLLVTEPYLEAPLHRVKILPVYHELGSGRGYAFLALADTFSLY